DYGQGMHLSEDARVSIRDAGHILGSGIVQVDLRAGSKPLRVILCGCLGRYHAKIRRDPSPFENTDYLLVESTYGNRQHPEEQTQESLAEIINQTARRGGSLVVPAFAIGRTQTLLYVIREMKADNRIPDLPVCVDDPMAIGVPRL